MMMRLYLAICLKWNFRRGFLFLMDSRPFFHTWVFTMWERNKLRKHLGGTSKTLKLINHSVKHTWQLLIFKWWPEIICRHFLVENLHHRRWHGTVVCCRLWLKRLMVINDIVKLTEQSTPNQRDSRYAICFHSHSASWNSRWRYDGRQWWCYVVDKSAILRYWSRRELYPSTVKLDF